MVYIGIVKLPIITHPISTLELVKYGKVATQMCAHERTHPSQPGFFSCDSAAE